LRIKKQETRLPLQEHGNDGDGNWLDFIEFLMMLIRVKFGIVGNFRRR